MPDSETKREAFDRLRKTVQEKADEMEKYSNVLPETKEQLNSIQDRLDSLETQANRKQSSTTVSPSGEIESQPEERKAFRSWLSGKNLSQEAYQNHLAKNAETKDLSIGTAGNQSDALAPREFVQEIIKDVVDVSPVRQVARSLQTERKQVEIPDLQGRPNGAFVSEGGTRSDDTGTDFGSDNGDMLKIDTHEYFVEIPITRQMIEDAVFDLEAEVRDLVSTEMDRIVGERLLRGTGTGEPQGMVSSADFVTTVTSDTSSGDITAITGPEIVELPLFLKQAYRRNGSWGVTREFLRHARTLRDANDNFIFQPGLSEGTPDTLAGEPYVEMQDLTDGNAASGDTAAVFGDYEQAYYVVDRLQMEVIRDPYSAKSAGRIEYHFRGRVGGDLALPEAARGIEIG